MQITLNVSDQMLAQLDSQRGELDRGPALARILQEGLAPARGAWCPLAPELMVKIDQIRGELSRGDFVIAAIERSCAAPAGIGLFGSTDLGGRVDIGAAAPPASVTRARQAHLPRCTCKMCKPDKAKKGE
jgi:hypothetical protein